MASGYPSQRVQNKSLELVKEQSNGATSTLYILEEGHAALAAGNSPESLICIFGKLKKGKSTLANMLLGRNAVFAMGSRGPCTTGIDMSPYPEPVKALQFDPSPRPSSISLSNLSLSRRESKSESFRVLDVEGAGDKGSDYDRRLYIPALLMSKVCIFNCQGQVGKQSFLNEGVISLDELWKDSPFADKVLLLRRNIHEQITGPASGGTRKLMPKDGPSALVLLEHVIHKVNEDGLVSPAGIVDAIVWRAYEGSLKVLRDGQQQLRAAARQMPPMSPAALQRMLQLNKKEVEQTWQQKVSTLWGSSGEIVVKFDKLMLEHKELQSEISSLHRSQVDAYGLEVVQEGMKHLKRFFSQVPDHLPDYEISRQLMLEERHFFSKLPEHMSDTTVSGPWLEAWRKHGQELLSELRQERRRKEKIESQKKESEREKNERDRLAAEAKREKERQEQVERENAARIARMKMEDENRRQEQLRLQQEQAVIEAQRRAAAKRLEDERVARERARSYNPYLQLALLQYFEAMERSGCGYPYF